MTATYHANDLLSGKDPVVRQIYNHLTAELRKLGAVTEEAKKTSVHLKAGPTGSAFAGVHPRKSGLLLNIRTASAIASERIRKVEQVSKNRFHNELLLTSVIEIDTELLGWLKAAYALTLGPA